jgi:hypothetical protein
MHFVRIYSITLLAAASLLVTAPPAWPLGLDDLTQAEMNGGLKEALTTGASAAVALLGKQDGFLGNPAVRIPLPPNLVKAEKYMRKLGQGERADELIVAMNRAAEAAVPEAKTLLVDAVKKMTVTDAKSILTGGDDATTQFFKRTTKDPLAKKFLPIVKQATDRVGLVQTYNNFVGTAAKFGLLKHDQSTIEAYVADKALDGLYLMIAEEERAIRRNPVSYGGKLLGKVFGALQ